jgi:hypothetical protein
MDITPRKLDYEFYDDDMYRMLLRTVVREYGDVSGTEEQSILLGVNRLSDAEVERLLQTENLTDEDDVEGWNDTFADGWSFSVADRDMFIRLAAATIEAVNNLAPESDEEKAPEEEKYDTEEEPEMEGAGVKDGIVMPVNYNHGSIPFGDFF